MYMTTVRKHGTCCVDVEPTTEAVCALWQTSEIILLEKGSITLSVFFLEHEALYILPP